MDEPISAIMETPALTVAMDDGVEQIETLMREQGVSAVPVVDRATGALTGIISMRDLARGENGQRATASLQAWEICSYKPAEVGPGTPLAKVAELMVARGIHHVVVTENNEVVGMVSALDFVKRFIGQDKGEGGPQLGEGDC